MKKRVLFTIITGGIAFLGFLITAFWGEFFESDIMDEGVGPILMTVAGIPFACFGVSSIVYAIKRDSRPYLPFAITDGVILLAMGIVCIYDTFFSGAFLHGLLTLVLLITLVPYCVVMLVVDIILGAVNRKKQKAQNLA